MNVRRLVAESGLVLLLAIGSFLLSAITIAALLYWCLWALGFTVPFLYTLLFGALISATDPVAVLALFKEYGAPRRLALIFEGESLFNDATAVALFLIILGLLTSGAAIGSMTILAGLGQFATMLIGGVLFGLLVGFGFAYLVGLARESEIASITLTIVLAHITFILAEFLSTVPLVDDVTIPLSPIISTTVASLLMGNYGRAKIHPRAEEFVSRLWEQLAFMANSLIFILIGILIVDTSLFATTTLFIIAVTVLIVALARALSIYPILALYNLGQSANTVVPRSWQHVLAWGSLRGALAVTMVLLVPSDLTLPGWNLPLTPAELLLALTVGCIAATLFIKAPTISPLMRRLALDRLTPMEELEYQEARALMHQEVAHQLERYLTRGYVDTDIAEQLMAEHRAAFRSACDQVQQLPDTGTQDLAVRVLRLYAIGIEKRWLKELYHHQEVSEAVYRHLAGKLQLQQDAIEHGNLAPDTSLHTDGRDVFEQIAGTIRSSHRSNTPASVGDRYMYYRAQAIISRKVLKELTTVHTTAAHSIFTSTAVEHVLTLYTTFKERSEAKLTALASDHPETAQHLAYTLAEHSVHTIEERVLADIYHKELITPKLYITLTDEIRAEQTSRTATS
jgi:CPA1 family monovalent cation:H+ antiporter